jgi:hypothetical protein
MSDKSGVDSTLNVPLERLLWHPTKLLKSAGARLTNNVCQSAGFEYAGFFGHPVERNP